MPVPPACVSPPPPAPFSLALTPPPLARRAPLQDGWTAVMYAAGRGHKDCVEALVKAGARLDIQNKVTLTLVLAHFYSMRCF